MYYYADSKANEGSLHNIAAIKAGINVHSDEIWIIWYAERGNFFLIIIYLYAFDGMTQIKKREENEHAWDR